MNTTAQALEAFQAAFARAVAAEFPEALGLIEFAQTTITGATSPEDLKQQVEVFFDAAAARAAEEGLDYITGADLYAAYAENF